jgi:hypothetical protein
VSRWTVAVVSLAIHLARFVFRSIVLLPTERNYPSSFFLIMTSSMRPYSFASPGPMK